MSVAIVPTGDLLFEDPEAVDTSGGVLQSPAPSFTNETNTALSAPNVDVDAITAALNGIHLTPVHVGWPVTVAPRDPAAASAVPATEAANEQKKANPVVWVGLALVAVGIWWALKGASHAG